MLGLASLAGFGVDPHLSQASDDGLTSEVPELFQDRLGVLIVPSFKGT